MSDFNEIYFFGRGVKNLLPTADIIYSLDRIRPSFAGNSIEIRRVSDSASLVVGFDVNGELDIDAIDTFSSGFTIDCRVSFYESKGTLFINHPTIGNNVYILYSSQASLQPYIVRNNGLVTDNNGNVALDFQGGTFYLSNSYLSATATPIMDSDCLVVHVFESQSTNSVQELFNEGLAFARISQRIDTRTTEPSDGYRHSLHIPSLTVSLVNYPIGSPQLPTSAMRLHGYQKIGTTVKIYDNNGFVNQELNLTETFSQNNMPLVLGRNALGLGTPLSFEGKHTATFIFIGQKTDNERDAIFNEIKAKYGIL